MRTLIQRFLFDQMNKTSVKHGPVFNASRIVPAQFRHLGRSVELKAMNVMIEKRSRLFNRTTLYDGWKVEVTIPRSGQFEETVQRYSYIGDMHKALDTSFLKALRDTALERAKVLEEYAALA